MQMQIAVVIVALVVVACYRSGQRVLFDERASPHNVLTFFVCGIAWNTTE